MKSLDEKYNVLYVNTPWGAMEESTMAKFPASAITSEDAACFMWVDSYTVAKATKLLDEWGFKFHSVYQVLDVAKHPWMEKGPAKHSTAVKKDEMDVAEGDADGAAEVAAEGTAKGAAAAEQTKENEGGGASEGASAGAVPKQKRKMTRKPRAPPINPPHWWTTDNHDILTPSRPTTEQLWLAVKGDPSKLFSTVSLAFNVINRPELGKKSRSKKPDTTDRWDTERPVEFLHGVLNHLKPEAKVLNVFASTVNDKVDSWGPGLPGGYLSSMKANSGLIGVLNKVLRSLKKTQLHDLCMNLPKAIAKEDGAKVEDIPTWPQIESAACTMPQNPGYNFKEDNGDVCVWVLKLVHLLSHNNMQNFTSLHSKKKKRKACAEKDPNRPRHGIASKSVVSKELTQFLGLPDGETIARTQVVSLLNKYIAANGLKDPVKKNRILPDDKLKALLQPPAGFGDITFFNICTLLKPHFPKSKKAIKEEKAGKGPAPGSVAHVDKKVCQ